MRTLKRPVLNHARASVPSSRAKKLHGPLDPNKGVLESFTPRNLRQARTLYERYVQSRPWINVLYRSLLEIRKNLKIVDVGCGTGYFTRYLCRLASGNCKLIGVDSRPENIRAASSDTVGAGLSDMVSFRMGDARDIPVDAEYADLTCCRSLLVHFPDPGAVIDEMVRITKNGGIVAAIEPGRLESFYDPADSEFTRLAEQSARAYAKAMKKSTSSNFGLMERLPFLFRRAGLREIKAEVQVDTVILGDPRTRLKDTRAQLREELRFFDERARVARHLLLTGGMSPRSIQRYFQLQKQRLAMLLSESEAIRNDATFRATSSYIVVGRKRVGSKVKNAG